MKEVGYLKTLRVRVEEGLGKVPFLNMANIDIKDAIASGLLTIKRDQQNGVVSLHGADAEDLIKVQKLAFDNNIDLCKADWKMELLSVVSDVSVLIQNEAHLSFVYRNTAGIVTGYLIAYRGKSTDHGDIIYISDWVSLGDSLASGKLMISFLREYAKNYIDNNILLPIYINARATTSGRVVFRKLESLASIVNRNLIDSSRHIKFVISKQSERVESGEEFIDMLITPVSASAIDKPIKIDSL